MLFCSGELINFHTETAIPPRSPSLNATSHESCKPREGRGFTMMLRLPDTIKAECMLPRQFLAAAWTLLPALLLTNAWGARLIADNPKSDRSIEFADLTGQKHKPLSVPDSKATVFFFLLTDCPNSNAYAPEIKRICEAYDSKKVAAFIVHADPDVTVEIARTHAKDYALPCPVLLDPSHRLVEFTGVTTAPEVAVVSPDGKVLYKGRIDDLFADFGKRRPEPTRRDLREALDAILAGKDVITKSTKAIGCPLPEPKK